MRRYTTKELATLRVGDMVRIHIRLYASDPKGVPFDARIVKIEHEANFDSSGHGRPIIFWEPRPNIDYMKLHDGTMMESAFCDSSWIVEFLERAPYKCQSVVTNELTKSEARLERFGFAHRRPGYLAASPKRVAETVLSRHHHLQIPYGISEEKLSAEWEKAGHPGLSGFYDYYAETVVAVNGRAVATGRGGTLRDAMTVTWINVPKFSRWLLRRLPHIVTTKREFRTAMAEHYAREMRGDYDYEFGAIDNYDNGTDVADYEQNSAAT